MGTLGFERFALFSLLLSLPGTTAVGAADFYSLSVYGLPVPLQVRADPAAPLLLSSAELEGRKLKVRVDNSGELDVHGWVVLLKVRQGAEGRDRTRASIHRVLYPFPSERAMGPGQGGWAHLDLPSDLMTARLELSIDLVETADGNFLGPDESGLSAEFRGMRQGLRLALDTAREILLTEGTAELQGFLERSASGCRDCSGESGSGTPGVR